MDLVDAVLAACDRHGAESGLSSASRSGTRIETLTYTQLGAAIRSTAEGLRAQGMSRGDRVLFSVRPGPDAVILALGIVLAGGTVVFADPGAGEALFRARTALAAPKWVAAESLLYLASTPLLRRLARGRGLDLPDYARIVPGARHLYAGPWLPGVPRRGLGVGRLAGGVSKPPTGRPGGLDTPPAAALDPLRGLDTRPVGVSPRHRPHRSAGHGTFLAHRAAECDGRA